MIFKELLLHGVVQIEPERIVDERGFFARTWCQREFTDHKLDPNIAQCNISFNAKKHTLRGLHYQVAPHAEDKLVRCTMGAIYDVVVDIRPESPTYTRSLGIVLDAQSRIMLYIPSGIAHGYITLVDDTEVFYQMSEFYYPECARGVRWNDPLFQIPWPASPDTISSNDASYADFLA